MERIGETISSPSAIRESVNDDKVRLYYKMMKNIKKYLVVVVKYLNNHGIIRTSFYANEIR